MTTVIHEDYARELNMGHWKDICDRCGGIKRTTKYSHLARQNRYEQVIKEKKRKHMIMRHRKKVQGKGWDFSTVYATDLQSMTAFTNAHMKWRNPHEMLIGDMPNTLPV